MQYNRTYIEHLKELYNVPCCVCQRKPINNQDQYGRVFCKKCFDRDQGVF